MTSNLFVNAERQLRSGWWIRIFLLVFASLLVPMLIAAQQNSNDVSIGGQALSVTRTSVAATKTTGGTTGTV